MSISYRNEWKLNCENLMLSYENKSIGKMYVIWSRFIWMELMNGHL